MERAFIYGDSLLKATMPDADMRYHFHLPEVMAQYPSDRLEVVNRAKMGATVTKGLALVEHDVQRGMDARWALVAYGGNDSDFDWEAVAAAPEQDHLPRTTLPEFTEKLRRGETIKIFNMGDCRRDFTYVDDIVEGVKRVMDAAPEVKMGEDGLPLAAHRVYNIGNSHPENLLDFVDTLQRVLVEEGVLPTDYDFEAHKQLVPMQPGDVPVTYADTTALQRDLGYKPATPLEDGLRAFAKWYKRYYGGCC